MRRLAEYEFIPDDLNGRTPDRFYDPTFNSQDFSKVLLRQQILDFKNAEKTISAVKMQSNDKGFLKRDIGPINIIIRNLPNVIVSSGPRYKSHKGDKGDPRLQGFYRVFVSGKDTVNSPNKNVITIHVLDKRRYELWKLVISN